MQELSSMFMTHHLNVMHAPVQFYDYIPYHLEVMAWTQSGTDGGAVGRMYRTDRGNT